MNEFKLIQKSFKHHLIKFHSKHIKHQIAHNYSLQNLPVYNTVFSFSLPLLLQAICRNA